MERSVALRMSLAAIVGLSLAVAATQAEETAAKKYQLRYRFQPGSILHYTVHNESTIDVQVGTAADTVQHATESGRVLRVVSLTDDGAAVLEVSIEYVKLKAGEIEWDSRSGDDPPGGFSGIEETIGKPLVTITVSPTGELVAAEKGGVKAEAGDLDDAHFDLFPALPADPVAVGETWKEATQVDVMATPKLTRKVSLQRMYTLRGVQEGVATIDVRTIVLSPVRDPLEEGQLIQRTPSGSLRLHIDRGQLLERLLKIDNQVVGFQGPQTSLRVVGSRVESLSSEEKVATRPSEARAQ